MKIFNATNSQLDLPYGMGRLSIKPRSFSQDIMGTTDFIQVLVSSYDTDQVAILVGGPYELGMCASVPVSVGYVVQTTDEVIKRFGLGKKEEPKPEPEPEPEIPVVEGENSEDAVYVGEEPEPMPEPEPAPAPKKKRTTRRKKTSE